MNYTYRQCNRVGYTGKTFVQRMIDAQVKRCVRVVLGCSAAKVRELQTKCGVSRSSARDTTPEMKIIERCLSS